MWNYNYNNAEMVDTSMKVHHTSVGVGRVCGLSPSEWDLPAKVFWVASIFGYSLLCFPIHHVVKRLTFSLTGERVIFESFIIVVFTMW